MNLVYVLQYDTGGDNYEISSVYSSLQSAMDAVPVEWKRNDERSLWEGYHHEGGMWSLEVYPVLD